MDETNIYLEQLQQRIKNSLLAGSQTFIDIVRFCRGAYPTLILDQLRALDAQIVTAHMSGFSLSTYLRNTSDLTPNSSILDGIEGNPVLSSWYFTKRTCKNIGFLRDWSRKRLVFLGTPYLYEWFRRHNLGKERLLLDLDTVIIEKMSLLATTFVDRVISYDVSYELPEDLKGYYDCVFMDPPWYLNNYKMWIYRAFELVPKGSFYLSLYPELLRPSAAEERYILMKDLGSATDSLFLLTDFLEYDIPSFEHVQLKTFGIKDIRPWKLADLVVGEFTNDVRITKPGINTFISSEWREVTIGSLRVFIQFGKQQDNGKLILSPLPDGSIILSSPSRRNPALARVNVLTSRGHGLVTESPQELINVLEDLKVTYESGVSIQIALECIPIDISAKILLQKIFEEKIYE